MRLKGNKLIALALTCCNPPPNYVWRGSVGVQGFREGSDSADYARIKRVLPCQVWPWSEVWKSLRVLLLKSKHFTRVTKWWSPHCLPAGAPLVSWLP